MSILVRDLRFVKNVNHAQVLGLPQFQVNLSDLSIHSD